MSRILLVEDDTDTRTLVEHVLMDAGCDVDATRTENGARDRLRYHSYDLVIADAKLPDGTGMAVAEDAWETGTRTLIVTGRSSTLPQGMFNRYEVLLKPLRPNEVRDAVIGRVGLHCRMWDNAL